MRSFLIGSGRKGRGLPGGRETKRRKWVRTSVISGGVDWQLRGFEKPLSTAAGRKNFVQLGGQKPANFPSLPSQPRGKGAFFPPSARGFALRVRTSTLFLRAGANCPMRRQDEVVVGPKVARPWPEWFQLVLVLVKSHRIIIQLFQLVRNPSYLFPDEARPSLFGFKFDRPSLLF